MDKKDQWIDELIIWAARYAINRRSYANGTTAETISDIVKAGNLSRQTLHVLRKDIFEALLADSIPYEDQKLKWIEVRDTISLELEEDK